MTLFWGIVPGQLKIAPAIAFGILAEGKFSAGALMAIDKAKSVIFKEDWLDQIVSLEAIKTSVQDICAAQARRCRQIVTPTGEFR